MQSGSRRCGFICTVMLLASAVHAAETVQLKTIEQAGDLTKIQAIIEVNGELKLNPDGKKVTKLPLKGKGEMLYQERVLSLHADNEPRKDVRWYQSAEAKFLVGDGQITTQLSPDRRVVGVQTTPSQSVVYSPLGPLTRDELELIDIQGSSSVVSRLLPEREVQIGEKWSINNDTAAVLLRLDVVTDNKLESELKKVEAEIAAIEMTGRVSGSIGGVPSDLDVTAKYNFDLKQHRVTWLAMSIHENRAIGHAEPGFDVTARIRVSVEPLDVSPELAEEIVSKLPVTADPGTTMLTSTAGDGAFRLVYPRSWRVMVDRHDVTILRFLDQGEMIAQCNLSKLADAPANKLLSVETLQAEIQRSLSKDFGQIVEAKQFQTERGLRALRVVAAGQSSELPIQWIYYHLTDPKGHQAAVVFTLDAKLVERFGGEDQTLISAFEILPGATAKTPIKEAAAREPKTAAEKSATTKSEKR